MSQGHKNLKYSTYDGVLSTPWTFLAMPGSFLMAGLLNTFLGVGPFWFGIIAAMPALANALNIVAIPFIAKFMSVRDMALSISCFNTGLWMCAVITIGFLPTDAPNTAGLFFTILYALAALTLSLGAVAWTAWMGEIVPERLRGRYMGRRNRYTNLSTLVFMALCMFILHWLDASRSAYVLLGSIAVAGRFIAILVQHLIATKDPTGGAITRTNWAQDILNLRQEKALLRFVCFGIASGFFIAMHSTLAPLFAFNILQASAAEFTSYAIVATLSGTACAWLWGELIDRHGSVPVLIITFTAWRIGDLGWIFLSEDNRYWMYPMWVWGGAMATGYLLASFNLLLKLSPKGARSAGISLNLTATSIAAMIAPILVGSVLSSTELADGNSTMTYRIMLTIAGLGSLATIAILIRFKEPKKDPHINTIYGAMRTLRQLIVNQGATLSNNILLTKQRKDPQENEPN